MNKRKIKTALRYQLVFIFLLVLIAAGIILNINTGSVAISPIEIFKIIFLNAAEGSMESSIIWKIRLPRLLTAALLGGALSVSGFLLQTFFRNPIAGPFVLGISSGAKMVVGLVIIFVVGSYKAIPSWLMVFSAFAGSLLMMGLVLLFARKAKSMSMLLVIGIMIGYICTAVNDFCIAFAKDSEIARMMGLVLLFARKAKSMSMLLVIGIMIGYICTAVNDFCIAFAKDSEIASLTSWSMGSFSGAAWDSLGVICLLVFAALICSMLISKPMDAYQLGEGYAKSMGIHMKGFRIALIVLSSILSACVTAFAGPVSFVGIAVPQIAKWLMKTAKPAVIIPASFLSGAVFCMFCDLIARTAFAPTELSISTVTSIFGAPVVIGLMIERRSRHV